MQVKLNDSFDKTYRLLKRKLVDGMTHLKLKKNIMT
jgi:ribosomal protein S21